MQNFERKLPSKIQYVNEADFLREVKSRQRNQERDATRPSEEKTNGKTSFEFLMDRVYNSDDTHGNEQYIKKSLFETGDYTDWLNVNVAKEINRGKKAAIKPNPVDKYQKQIQEMYTANYDDVSSDWLRSQGYQIRFK